MFLSSYSIYARSTINTELIRVERALRTRNIDSIRVLFAPGRRIYLGIIGVNSGYYSLEQTLAILDGVTRRSIPISFKLKKSKTVNNSATVIGELKVQRARKILMATAVLGFFQCNDTWCINRILLY